jgi:hypothetical protein
MSLLMSQRRQPCECVAVSPYVRLTSVSRYRVAKSHITAGYRMVGRGKTGLVVAYSLEFSNCARTAMMLDIRYSAAVFGVGKKGGKESLGFLLGDL